MESYEVLKQIGKGACSNVSLVRDTTSQKLFALKAIEMDESIPRKNRDHVLREVELLQQLQHPHVVNCITWFIDYSQSTYLCIVMDYYNCGTLNDQVQKAITFGRYLPEPLIMNWFVQLSMAVEFLHSRRILHRDIKTRNVFLTKDNMIKLGDFGIARKFDSTFDTSQTYLGSPCYVSPEFCQDKPYGMPADVWSLGCLLYELCSLKCAFDSTNIISLFHKIVKGDYDEIPMHYSIDLSRLVHGLLSACPDNRPTARVILSIPYVRLHLNEFVNLEERRKIMRLDRRSMVKQMPCIFRRRAPSLGDRMSTSRLSTSSSLRSCSPDRFSRQNSYDRVSPELTAPQPSARRRARGMYRQARLSDDLLSPDPLLIDLYTPRSARPKPFRTYSAQSDAESTVPPLLNTLTLEQQHGSLSIKRARSPLTTSSFDETTVFRTANRPASAAPMLRSDSGLKSARSLMRSEDGSLEGNLFSQNLVPKVSLVSLSVSSPPSDADEVPEELPPTGSDVDDSETEIEEYIEADSPDIELQRLSFASREDFDQSDNEMEWTEVIGRAKQCLKSVQKSRVVDLWTVKSQSYDTSSSSLSDCVNPNKLYKAHTFSPPLLDADENTLWKEQSKSLSM